MDVAMTKEHYAEDRALLIVTAWQQGGEILGVIRWRASLDDRTETVIAVRGVTDLTATVVEQLRSLASDPD
jgi:hypothetical protein